MSVYAKFRGSLSGGGFTTVSRIHPLNVSTLLFRSGENVVDQRTVGASTARQQTNKQSKIKTNNSAKMTTQNNIYINASVS